MMGARPQKSPEEKGSPAAEGAGSRARDVFSAKMFSNAPLQKFGDLFPLPLPRDHGFLGEVASLASRRSRHEFIDEGLLWSERPRQ